MQQVYVEGKIVTNKQIEKNIYMISVEGKFEAKPGQFYMIRAWDKEPFLSRPISVYDLDDEKISFVYEVRGKGTEILSKKNCGDTIKLMGPCGNGFDVNKIKGKIAVVTGGIGIAPMLYTIKSIKDSKIDIFAGFREKSYITNEMKKYADNVYITTDNGSEGYKGNVAEIFNPIEYNAVLCCGPTIMMKKVSNMCLSSGTACLISMEEKMACGVGACLGCACNTSDGKKRVCKDGPVFWGREVILSA